MNYIQVFTIQVRKKLPYQGRLVLQTFSLFFKFMKDVQSDSGVPLPPSEYPKTALAIATAAVSRIFNNSFIVDYMETQG